MERDPNKPACADHPAFEAVPYEIPQKVMSPEQRRVEAYLGTLGRMEEVAFVDRDASLASIAISMKRIADAMEGDPKKMGFLDRLEAILQDAVGTLRRG